MRYYKHLYVSDDLKKKKAKIIRRLELNKLQLNVQLIVLPKSTHNQLEIIDSKLLFQPSYPKEDLFIVGILSSYEEALELVENMAREIYENTEDVDIRKFIMKKEQED